MRRDADLFIMLFIVIAVFAGGLALAFCRGSSNADAEAVEEGSSEEGSFEEATGSR